MKDKRKTFYDRCFKDSDGNLRLGEKANLPIMVFAGAAVVAFILPGLGRQLFALIAYGALFTWAWMELFAGTNYFRRVLGGLTLVVLLLVVLLFVRIDIAF